MARMPWSGQPPAFLVSPHQRRRRDLVARRVHTPQRSGHFQGLLPLEESSTADHSIELSLRRYRNRIVGFLTANLANDRGKFELPASVTLARTSRRP